jgi:hypothetical protein
MRYLNLGLFSLMAACTQLLTGCCGPLCEFNKSLDAQFTGGGEDAILADLPFDLGYSVTCTQGAYGATSHNATSTRFDVDLDTPNDLDVPVFAPVGGLAYVHDQNPDNGFGIHINLDLGDGTYLILAHLEAVFIDSESEVAAGQLLGYEGTTGNSSGDHVHLGRHAGDASLDGIYGESFDGLILNMSADGEHVQEMTTSMTCALPGGETYTSLLTTPAWHPNGSLVKTPDNPTVYQIDQGGLTPFLTESAFLTRNLDFTDVALISDSELSCYGVNPGLADDTEITAVFGAFPNQAVWLLMGADTDPDRYRLLVPGVGWQAVLKSWGIIASTYDDLYNEPEDSVLVSSYNYAGPASFRDGSLISRVEDSAVYVMSDGVAMPIETWDALLFSGWEDRTVIEMSTNEFESAVLVEGDCGTNTYCLSRDDVTTCGGPSESLEGINESIAEGDELILTWFTPDDALVDSITLAGAITHPGEPETPWGTVWMEVLNANVVTVTVPDLAHGDSLRFSVEYRDNGTSSWSCLAPYPPGLIQGSVTANYGGSYLGYLAADDPGSNGCGLVVSVP